MNSNDWVAEHVMGFERECCQGTMGGGNASSDGTCETWFYCDQCGRQVMDTDSKIGPCPKYPFPKFTLVDLMRKLGEKGYHVMVRVDPERERRKFTVMLNGWRVCDTDSPLKSLCSHLYRKRETWQRLEEALGLCHGPRKPEKKRFVGDGQVLEEYIPGYGRPKGLVDWGKLDWGLLCSRGECKSRRWFRNDPCVAAIFDKPTQEEESGPAFFANIRDAIKLLQKAMGQVEGK